MFSIFLAFRSPPWIVFVSVLVLFSTSVCFLKCFCLRLSYSLHQSAFLNVSLSLCLSYSLPQSAFLNVSVSLLVLFSASVSLLNCVLFGYSCLCLLLKCFCLCACLILCPSQFFFNVSVSVSYSCLCLLPEMFLSLCSSFSLPQSAFLNVSVSVSYSCLCLLSHLPPFLISTPYFACRRNLCLPVRSL
jgi:hypothetical protein